MKINLVTKILTIITFIIFVVFIIANFKILDNHKKLLLEHGIITYAKVTEFKKGYRFKKYVHFEYVVDQKHYKGSNLFNTQDLVVGDTLQLIYYPDDPEIHHLILDEEDMAYFGVPELPKNSIYVKRDNIPRLFQQSDSKRKFILGVPLKWDVDKTETDLFSQLICSDTSKSIYETMVVSALWNNFEVFYNDHFTRSLDSINSLHGLTTMSKGFIDLNGFSVYHYDAKGFDTLNLITFINRYYYLKNNDQQDHFTISFRTHKSAFNQNDLLLINKILRSLRRTNF